MNKLIMTLICIISSISFGQAASAKSYRFTASVEIVPNPSGIHPTTDGNLAVKGSDNNVQIAYLDKNIQMQGWNSKANQQISKDNAKISHSTNFTAQYE